MPKIDFIEKGWRFAIDPDTQGVEKRWFKPDFDRKNWLPVQVPGAWDFYLPEMRGYEGIAYYALTLPKNKIKAEQWQRLRFPRAFHLSKVWINGRLAGTNECGYLPLTVDLTPHLNSAGSQHVVISCDNRLDPGLLPGAKVVEWQQYGGLHETPELLTSSPAYLQDFRIRSEIVGKKAILNLSATVRNTRPVPVRGKILFQISRAGKELQVETAFSCKSKKSTTVQAVIEVENPRLWSPATPSLYQATANLKSPGGGNDSLTESFGIRSVATKGRQILLNGKPIRVRGFCRYDDLPGKGWAVSQKEILDDLRAIKETGANIIRTHYPHPKRFYQAADQVGLMVMSEIPLCWWRSEWHGPWEKKYENLHVIDKAEAALKSMIQVAGNQPSVIAWSMGNESATNDKLGIRAMRRLLALSKSEDPSRLAVFVVAGNIRGHTAMRQADVICSNIYWGLFMGPPARDLSELQVRAFNETHRDVLDMKQQYPNKPLIITEFGTHGLKGIQGPKRMSEDYQAAYIEGVHHAIVKADPDAGTIIWVWADYQHRRGFVGHGPMFPSDYGPYGVITLDRRKKKSHAAVCRMWK